MGGAIPGLEIAGKSEQGADPKPGRSHEDCEYRDVTAVTVTECRLYISYHYTTKTSNGITFTDMGNGGTKNYGEPVQTNITTFILNNNLFLPPGIYTKNVSEEFGLTFLISRYINNKYDIVVVRANDKTFDTSSWDYNKYEYRVLIQVTELETFNTIFYPMINRGDTALPWEPYQSKTASITLTKPLRGIGDYRDEITMTNRIDRCMELTFDGSEDCWGVYTSGSRTGFSAINVLPISMNNRNGICNQALVGGNEEVERMRRLMESGEVVFGGETDAAARYVAPTLLRDVAPDSPLMQQEIFGPLLPVLEFDDLEAEVVPFISEREKPLALYYFGERRTGEALFGRVDSGGGGVNDVVLHLANPALPFGGAGGSGMGQYHGRYSFETFSRPRSVLTAPRKSDFTMKYPPYKGFRMIRKLF